MSITVASMVFISRLAPLRAQADDTFYTDPEQNYHYTQLSPSHATNKFLGKTVDDHFLDKDGQDLKKTDVGNVNLVVTPLQALDKYFGKDSDTALRTAFKKMIGAKDYKVSVIVQRWPNDEDSVAKPDITFTDNSMTITESCAGIHCQDPGEAAIYEKVKNHLNSIPTQQAPANAPPAAADGSVSSQKSNPGLTGGQTNTQTNTLGHSTSGGL
jgi:hypothetical protein